MKLKTAYWMALAIIFTACNATKPSGQPWAMGGNGSILVIPDDSNLNTVEASSALNLAVLRSLGRELGAQSFGIQLNHPGDPTYQPIANPGNDRHVVGNAKGRDSLVDVAIIYAIETKVEEDNRGSRARMRIKGRLLNIHTGRRLWDFEQSDSRGAVLPKACDRRCMMEVLMQSKEALVADLAAKLGKNILLARSGRSTSDEPRRRDNDLRPTPKPTRPTKDGDWQRIEY